ncbi:2-formylbenzoate dehydrogenase [Pseudonocardia ammonioxydans]|uniref:2-formylbenzoate dehydrogenase n=1 Tax=Pseudonocardia ammonioxydans TaxID=260086 RepID=A0A1I5FXR4_PSUAM|nr:aldehyde dehydrogenase family protein [Pseudonocardia ammonioxydans]SFO28560.1 2-formylbenzoate dehydrogenase [Pseudonocardia ammonioxydans]
MTVVQGSPAQEGAALRANEARVAQLLARDWRLLVGDGLVPARSGRTFTVQSPYTEQPIAEVPDAGEEDVEAAVAAASAAARDWRRTPVLERARYAEALADAIDERADDFALLDAIDAGSPITEMRADAARASAGLRVFAGLALELKGNTIPASENLHLTVREPFGVVARIVPFNHPFMFAAGKIAAALVAGNTVVLKPPELAPLSALLFGEVAKEVLPPGVLSIVVGDGPEAPRALVRHKAVRRIGFIGSVGTGTAIQRDAAGTGVKEVTLELGGKNALLAFPDADPLEVARSAVAGMNFTWAGQSCGSTSRLLVHESVADEVVNEVVRLLGELTITSPLDPVSEMGTVISRPHHERILKVIEDARAEGAELLTGGGRPAHLDRGYFIEPTVLAVEPSARVAQEEVFGPVLSVLRWKDEGEAVALANSLDYGLTAAVWTNDIRRAHRVADELEAGFVWVNGSSRHFPGVPYGGVKNSGIGREEGVDELLSYTTVKSINVMR